MTDQRIAEICEKTDQIRAIYDGYNTANYSLLVEYVDYLLNQLSKSQRREKAAVEDITHNCSYCKYELPSGACKLIPDGDECSPDYTEGFDRDDCERWEWRGPVDEKGVDPT